MMTEKEKKEALEFAAAAAFAILIEAMPELEKSIIPQVILETHIKRALNEILEQKPRGY